MTSTGADREQRRARHAQRVDRLRTARKHRPVTSTTTTVDPFALVGAEPLEAF